MSDQIQQPHGFESAPPTAVLVDAAALWLGLDDDLALGCECAYPSLQIERWGLEAGQPMPYAA